MKEITKKQQHLEKANVLLMLCEININAPVLPPSCLQSPARATTTTEGVAELEDVSLTLAYVHKLCAVTLCAWRSSERVHVKRISGRV